MEEYTVVQIDSLRVSLISQQRILLLKDTASDLYLPIYIGPFEAESIMLALQEIELNRPNTHDLTVNIIKALDGTLLCSDITEIKENTYYAELLLRSGDTLRRVSCRPSDAISLAIRTRTPVRVHREVFEEAGIRKEEDIHTIGKSVPKDSPEADSNSGDLSVFEDFFNSIDLDDQK